MRVLFTKNKFTESDLKKLFDAEFDRLFDYLFYKCGNEALAKDIAQDSFIKIWDKRTDIKTGKEVGLLFTIASNLLKNHFEHENVVLKFENSTIENNYSESPEEVYRRNEFQETLEKAISELPEINRVVFLMNRINGDTYIEIAKKLEISTTAVEKRMRKALDLLNQKLNLKL